MNEAMRRLEKLFAPDRVAVIGATEREGSVGRALMENLGSFTGEVVPVNPNYEEVLGIECVPTIHEANGADLAVIAVPATAAIAALREVGEAGVRNVVVITAGFGESGSDGSVRERDLVSIAEEYDLNLVGPNSLGIQSSPRRLNATFGPDQPPSGRVSFLSQSGAFVTAVIDWAREHGLGFKDVVSLGNKAVLDERDFVATWGRDPDTDVIVGYLEGIEDGTGFIDVASEVSRETPIVLVKSGRTDAGARAASSHTGAIAGSDRAYEAGLQQAGVLRTESVQELFDAAQVLSGQPTPDGDGVAIVTNAGGPGVMATDAVGDSELSLASLREDTLSDLQESLPDGGNPYNPVDVVGDADVERFRGALDVVLGDENVDLTVVLSAPTAVLSFEELADTIVDLQARHGKPVVASLMGGARVNTAKRTLADAGIPTYFDPARAIRSLEALVRYRDVSEREPEPPMHFEVDRQSAEAVLDRIRSRDDHRVGVEAMDLLEAYGISIPEGEVVDDPASAERIARQLDSDVVMKIVSPDILHKTDIGGVKVGVSEENVRDAYEDLVIRAYSYQPDAKILGVQVQEMIDLDDGVETIVGMTRDPQFGPLLAFGLGGIFVELLEDVSFRVAPVGEREASTMIDEIDAAPLLRGARGRDPVDEAAIVETLGRLSQLVTDVPEILELDINPLVVTPDGAVAIDLRLTVDPDTL